ncbi:MAG: ABC transporter permease [Planctomycetes bacterium]|nr:ABC transporter permease [Planctomycetota bacterium]
MMFLWIGWPLSAVCLLLGVWFWRRFPGFRWAIWPLFVPGIATGLVEAAGLLAIAGLLLVILLQAVGVLRRVPFSYNLRNLMVRWRVTLLTASAFTLVVGLMVVMLAFVQGMYKLTQGSGRPGNVLVLADGATDELFSNLGFGDVEKLPHDIPGVLQDENGHYLVSWETYMIVNQPVAGADQNTGKRRFIQVRGIVDPEISGRVHGLDLYPGGAWFDKNAGAQPLPKEKGNGNAVQGVLGEGLARELGKDFGKNSLAVGDVFDLGPRQWIVTGILKSSGSTFDSEVWAKQSLAGDLFGKNSYTTAVLATADAASAQSVAEDATRNFKTPAVKARPEVEYYEDLNTTNQQFLYAILFVAVFMAVGGVFGVMNTMFAAISQRIKDIGVLRILGYPRWQILASFFLESLLLALVGGVIGCAIGSLSHGWTASSILSGSAGGGKSVVLKMVVDARTLAAGLGFSLLMGAIGGLVPALSAMRLKPLESLR